MNHPTQPTYLHLLRQGNAHALGNLYDQYAGMLYGFILKNNAGSESAEQLLLESFVNIRKEFQEWNQDAMSLLTWMFQVTKRTIAQKKNLNANNFYREILSKQRIDRDD